MYFFSLVAYIVSTIWAVQTAETDKITGKWISPKKDFIVECYKAGNGKYHGKLVWFQKLDGKKRYDCDIPENEWIGKDILWDFHFAENEWKGGNIKDLKKCNTYDAYIAINASGQLTATGFIAFRWLGETMVFNKYTQKLPMFNPIQ